ncbi:hypothetical protein [Thiolapillus sp.]|uniref:hypothetical protein n=1 Tax=Thiolapillus sp. TaxID=2017437 RepID=UPI003AF79979
MTRTAGAQIGCQRPSRFWGLGCPKIYHEVEDTLVLSRRLAFYQVASPAILSRNVRQAQKVKRLGPASSS